MSLSAHKFYGPKGIGALYVRRSSRLRIEPLLYGGGHESGLRSGTLNVPGIVGMAKALELCTAEMASEPERLRGLRNALYEGLVAALSGVTLNGPSLDRPDWRLPANLNVGFAGVEGETVLLKAGPLAASSGSACTSANPEPSHVLLSLGLTVEQARSSLRFGLGRFNTRAEVGEAVGLLVRAVTELRALGGAT